MSRTHLLPRPGVLPAFCDGCKHDSDQGKTNVWKHGLDTDGLLVQQLIQDFYRFYF